MRAVCGESRAVQWSETMRLGLGQAGQSRYNHGNSKRDTMRHGTKNPRADPQIPRSYTPSSLFTRRHYQARTAFAPSLEGTLGQIPLWWAIVDMLHLLPIFRAFIQGIDRCWTHGITRDMSTYDHSFFRGWFGFLTVRDAEYDWCFSQFNSMRFSFSMHRLP